MILFSKPVRVLYSKILQLFSLQSVDDIVCIHPIRFSLLTFFAMAAVHLHSDLKLVWFPPTLSVFVLTILYFKSLKQNMPLPSCFQLIMKATLHL